MDKNELKQQITEATKKLEGLTVLEILQAKYTVRFRFSDTETGFQYFEVHKLGTNHRYTVKVQFVISQLHQVFAVRGRHCNCPRFTRENNCHHFLITVFEKAEAEGMGEIFDLSKFTDYRLAQCYRKELEQEMVA